MRSSTRRGGLDAPPRQVGRRDMESSDDSKWGLGLPAAVEEALVNGLPQEDALRLRLVSKHWAK
jgi:hypothetical protein